MTKKEDEDTAPLRIPDGAGRRSDGSKDEGISDRELSPATRSLTSRWQSERSYEFATPETALVYTACAVAVSMVTGVWPSVELCRERVSVRLGGEEEAGAAERLAWRELTGWARRLGGRAVAGEV